MGKKKVVRAVLDTNVLVSALLFRGPLSRLVEFWQQGRFIPVFSRATFEEFRAVLAYPKFDLTPEEIALILEEEVLPFAEVTGIGVELRGVCRDPGDDKFLSCAVSAAVDCIVSGDRDLTGLREYESIPILSPAEFLDLYPPAGL